LSSIPNKGDSVIDIFAGSGQTNCAAEKLGRRHLGIETQQQYIDYALAQLNQIGAQQELFDSE
jgi:site-specific DNA-methyltransferase (adenine-specific)